MKDSIVSGKPINYLRFVSISTYYVCCNLPASITIVLRFVSIDTSLFPIDAFSSDIKQFRDSLKVQPFWVMASKQTWRTDQQFENFVQKFADSKWTCFTCFFIRLCFFFFFSSCLFPSPSPHIALSNAAFIEIFQFLLWWSSFAAFICQLINVSHTRLASGYRYQSVILLPLGPSNTAYMRLESMLAQAMNGFYQR